MSNLQQFVKANCVHSKLAEKPIVGQWKHLTLVFIHGYPMTLRGFYMLCTKAIFGSTLHLNSKVWNELHAETKLLCQGLGHQLKEEREAFSVIEGIRVASGWNMVTAEQSGHSQDRTFLTKWIEEVDTQITTLRDQPPQ